jgi:hypothetical protein
MNGLQLLALVQFVSSDFLSEGKAQAIGNSVEKACVVNRSQSFQICGGGR